MRLLIIGVCLLQFASFSIAQGFSVDSLSWQRLDEVQINALSIPRSKFDYGGMVGVVDQEQLLLSNPTIATEIVNRVPGVYWHSGALNTNRITIRGVGSRSPFSTNKIRAYFQDIPLTDGGGETTIEDIDLHFVGGYEIQKGANSSLYGAGLGGTIFLNPQEAEAANVEASATVGSFGLLRTGLKATSRTSKVKAVAGFQHQQSDGYRENNAFDRQSFFTSLHVDQVKNTFKLLLLSLDQKAFIPSSLGLTDFNNNPRAAAQNWQEAQGFEDYDRWLTGLSWERRIGKVSKIITSIYSTGRDAYEPRPFNILVEKTNGIGIRSRWQRLGQKLSLNVGFEGYRDEYDFRTFENLYQSNPGKGSVQGDLIEGGKQPRGYFNVFAESTYSISENLLVNVGANLNQTSYRLEQSFPSPANSENLFDPILSPRVSLTYQPRASFNLFATVSHGFSPPSVDEITNEDGSLNPEIRPEIGWNREIGVKHFGRRFNYEFSIFSMDIQDLLVSRRTAEDVVFGVNAGRTIHNGLELDASYLLLDQGNSQLKTSITYSLADYRFETFVDDQNDFSGNQLTGVPKNQLSVRLDHQWKWLFSGLSYQFIDAMPITDDNNVFSESYQLVNFYAGGNVLTSGKWSGSLTLRLNNIFDEVYASMLSINAQAFGANEPRYYYPGLPFNYQLSASIRYLL